MDVSSRNRIQLVLLVCAPLLVTIMTGCFPSPEDLAEVDYAPIKSGDWEVATPEEVGLAPMLLAELYYEAGKLESIYSLLVVKNGRLVAEGYFNGGSVDRKQNLMSATKSVGSALVGIALEQGHVTSLDEPYIDYFPDYYDQVEDLRKREITVRHLLQMRSGYPWEESSAKLWEIFVAGDFLGLMADLPLATDPGTAFHYSNLSSHHLGVIVERASGIPLETYAQEELFDPLGAELGEWYVTASDDRYPMTSGGMHITARDAAKFGLLYLDDGVFDGEQIVSSQWVRDSLQSYSTADEVQYLPRTGPNFNTTGYGYQWWVLQAGEHRYNAALGHGGQTIALLDELDMVVVALGDPFWLEHDGNAWKHEKQLNNLVADFVASLPNE